MKNDFLNLILLCFRKEVIKKLVFSRPVEGDVSKVSARLVSHRNNKFLSFEYSLPGNTVSQKNVTENDLFEFLSDLYDRYKQINLITTLGDAERKISKSGKEVLLGADTLQRKLQGSVTPFHVAVESLDTEKNYILTGKEDFLITLGISDKNGRVHDKKQGKFRQINRFLEYIGDIYDKLPQSGDIVIYDLCSGKSYLSFAVYYYLTEKKSRKVSMTCIDLKRDVIDFCEKIRTELGYDGMKFITANIKDTPKNSHPDMVISLHACDIATDIVINTAVLMGAKIILSTPCCHNYLNKRIDNKELGFVTRFPKLRDKLCEAITDALRLKRLESFGYSVTALELTSPDNTPKNTLLRAIKDENMSESKKQSAKSEYEDALKFILSDKWEDYLKEID